MTNRLLSLDVFRGLTVAGMILVNSPGNQTAYALLDHSRWNGCTFADLVFPFFLFIVGVSLVFSLAKQREQGFTFGPLWEKIIKRTAMIFLLGIFLNAFPNHLDFSTLRIFGVLQRIAVCYFFGALFFLTTRARTQFFICMGLLISYWLIMTLIPVPGYGVDNLTPAGNLAAYIDRQIFSAAHLYGKFFDPEGILSTLPAIATTLIGNLTGIWLLTNRSQQKKLVGILSCGWLAMLLGWLWGFWFPINKTLWTGSFVLWTAGLGLCLLGLCYWSLEIKHWRRWSKPFEIFGLNALAAYFLHILFLRIQHQIHLPNADGSVGNLRLFITAHVFDWTSLKNASLLYALSYIGLWLGFFAMLYRRKIFIRF